MLELHFDIEPDANGVIDGRELACAMIVAAYELLAPYVNACPVCTNTLFSAIAKSTIEGIHQNNGTRLPGRIIEVEADPDGARWRKHVAEADALTDALLGKPVHPHHLN